MLLKCVNAGRTATVTAAAAAAGGAGDLDAAAADGPSLVAMASAVSGSPSSIIMQAVTHCHPPRRQ